MGPRTIKAYHALKRTIITNGKEARVLFVIGKIGVNLISIAFVTTHGIPCTAMKEPLR